MRKACNCRMCMYAYMSLAVLCLLMYLLIPLSPHFKMRTTDITEEHKYSKIIQVFTPRRESSVVVRQQDIEFLKEVTRQKHMAKACSAMKNMTSNLTQCKLRTQEMYVGEEHQYIYCQVAKAACTNWKRTLLRLAGYGGTMANGTDHGHKGLKLGRERIHDHSFTDKFVPRLIQFSAEQAADRLSRYFKFMFVREPLERLLSAYRDKMFRDPVYRKYFVPKIAKRYRPAGYNGSRDKRKSAIKGVTFAEFVRFVLDSWTEAGGNVQSLNPHWRPQADLCCPCRGIQYDFIGHHETLDRDVEYVLNRLHGNIDDVKRRSREVVEFPKTDLDNVGGIRSAELVRSFYADVPEDDVRKLFALYAMDYELFGFEHPQVLSVAR